MPEINAIHYPDSYNDLKDLRDEYVDKKTLLLSLDKLERPSEAKKLKDYLVGLTYAKEGVAFQYKKLILLSFMVNGDPKDLLELSRYAWRDN